MIADGRLLQFLIAEVIASAILIMAAATREIECQIGLCKGTILVKLGGGMRIDGHQVGPKVTAELFRIPQRALGDARHMAVHTLGVATVRDLLIHFVFKVTVLAIRLDAQPLRILDGLMWVVTIHAAHDPLLGFEEFLVLFMMLDKATAGVDLGHITSDVTLTTKL